MRAARRGCVTVPMPVPAARCCSRRDTAAERGSRALLGAARGPPRAPAAATRASGALPLAGIAVADLTQTVAGPFCTQTLGDRGADVVKVERPGRGDDARAWGPPFWERESAVFVALNRNKKSLALDLKREGGIEILRRLVARADVFVQSLRAGVIGERGLGFA